MTSPAFTLRRYAETDENAAIELWRRTWSAHFPHIDFDSRVAWWRERWRQDLVPVTAIVVAECDGRIAGFMTIDEKTGYLDQIVVAPEAQHLQAGQLLVEAAKHVGREGLYLHVNKDNARALGFYQKCGFVIAGEDVNRRSGAPVYMMTWRPD